MISWPTIVISPRKCTHQINKFEVYCLAFQLRYASPALQVYLEVPSLSQPIRSEVSSFATAIVFSRHWRHDSLTPPIYVPGSTPSFNTLDMDYVAIILVIALQGNSLIFGMGWGGG